MISYSLKTVLNFSTIAFLWVVCCLSTPLWAYDVVFKGIEDSDLLTLIESASQLEKLKDSAPDTYIGLKRRAEGDIANVIQALHSQAYYDAKVNVHIEADCSRVVVSIQPGPIYPLAGFHVRYLQNDEEISNDSLACPITLDTLKIQVGLPALPETILAAEDALLDNLNLQGYAFASIKKRDVFADQQAKNIIVWIAVETGPLTYFGPTRLIGLERVRDIFFYKKLRWQEGDLYDPRKIEKTQEALELSGLFRSVNIQQTSKEPVDGNLLPLEISVLEGKQRSVGFGLNFATTLGFGITGEWEDRNISGSGHKLSLRADVWQKMQEGSITYLVPDFGRQDQNLILAMAYHHERIKAFTESDFTISATIERKINEHLRFSYGGMYELLRSARSDRDGTFDLIKFPLQLRWSNTDSMLDPTKGGTIQIKVIPSVQILAPQFGYSINTFTGTIYRSLTENKRHVFAAKLMLGTIVGASKHDIPTPDRFLAGSETTLRGYRYKTVCPLGRHDKPLGGRSLFIYSLELRNRIGKNLGLTLFYDVGNVYKNFYPDFKRGFLQSAGIGIAYYTPIGPIRLDLAVPLNKRHIDHSLEAYFSIGQSF